MKTEITIEPLSRLSLLLAIARARERGFDSFAHALVKLYLVMYGEGGNEVLRKQINEIKDSIP